MRLKFGEAYGVKVTASADKICCECGAEIKQRRPYVRVKAFRQKSIAFCVECEPFNDDEV